MKWTVSDVSKNHTTDNFYPHFEMFDKFFCLVCCSYECAVAATSVLNWEIKFRDFFYDIFVVLNAKIELLRRVENPAFHAQRFFSSGH